MSEKELIKKLNNLKQIKPDNEWKKNYRDILYSQISAGINANTAESNWKIIWENIMPGKTFIQSVRSVWLTTAACVLILITGIGGVYVSKNSKPGDSLYIAKIISEKAQLAITFNEKEKAKLGLEFASNRAKEITQVLEESKEPAVAKNEKVAQLSQNFKKEISEVKNRLSAIKSVAGSADEETQLFGANLGKTDQRLEIAEPKTAEPAKAEKPVTAPSEKGQPAANATSTRENLATPDTALNEAEKLFDEKNYSGSIDKLREADKLIGQSIKDAGDQTGQTGMVKGASETATSTK